MYPPVEPVLIQLGPLALRWYGLLVVVGIALGGWIASRYVVSKGQDPNAIWDGLVWVLLPALLGARLYYVFIQSPRGPEGLQGFLANPISILDITRGGLHIFGAFIFGAAALFLYIRRRKLPLLIYLDAVGLALPLGQAVARWANFINQELYGPPTDLPWGLRIDPEHRIPPYNDLTAYPDTVRFHPLFLYESLWNFLGFGLMSLAWRRFGDRLRDGDLALIYLIWYPLGRFFIEFARTDSWFFPGTPFNLVHVLSALAVVGATTALVVRRRKHPPVNAKARTASQ